MVPEHLVVDNKRKNENDDDFKSSNTQSKNRKRKKGKRHVNSPNTVSSRLVGNNVEVKIET